MVENYIELLGGCLLFLLLLLKIVLITWLVAVKDATLVYMMEKLQISNVSELTEVLQRIIAKKERLENCALEKIIFQIKNTFPREELRENSTQTEEAIVIKERIKMSLLTGSNLEGFGSLIGSIEFSPEEHCEIEKELVNKKEQVIQTDENGKISVCSACRIRSEKQTDTKEHKAFNLLSESESRPGIYQPPKRRESICDFSSDISSISGDNSYRDRKRAPEIDSDSDCSDWRKVPERKYQNSILFSGMDKHPPLRSPSPIPSAWNLLGLTNETRVIDIRGTQQNQINFIKARKQHITEKDTRSPLIIGVDARPTIFSGYCLNLKTRVCQFYSFPSKYLPWKLHAEIRKEGNSSEFEMKNMMFALLLWEKEIEKYKKFSIFTDNGAINYSDCQYGSVVTAFLEHLTGCKNYIRVNSNSHVHRRRSLDNFSRFIQPADDLTHFNLDHFKDFMKKTYGVVSFTGSHDFFRETQSQISHHNGKVTDRYPTSVHYWSMLDKANQGAKNWTKGCKSCGFFFPLKSFDAESMDNRTIKKMPVPILLSQKEDVEKGIFSIDTENFPSL